MHYRRRGSAWHRQFPYLELIYALVYSPLLIAGSAFAVWYELSRKAVEYNHSAADSVYAIIIDVGYVGIADAAVTFGVVEGGAAVMVLARRFAEIMDERKRERMLQSGREVQRRWDAWNYRRLQAQEQGIEFDEPSPRFDDEGGDRIGG